MLVVRPGEFAVGVVCDLEHNGAQCAVDNGFQRCTSTRAVLVAGQPGDDPFQLLGPAILSTSETFGRFL